MVEQAVRKVHQHVVDVLRVHDPYTPIGLQTLYPSTGRICEGIPLLHVLSPGDSPWVRRRSDVAVKPYLAIG